MDTLLSLQPGATRGPDPRRKSDQRGRGMGCRGNRPPAVFLFDLRSAGFGANIAINVDVCCGVQWDARIARGGAGGGQLHVWDLTAPEID